MQQSLRDEVTANLRGRGEAPPHLQQLSLPIYQTNDRSQLVGEDSRKRRRVSGIVARHTKSLLHRGVCAVGAVETAHTGRH